jgi:hypothetical protein
VIRRHPVLSIVAGGYVVALSWITLTPAPFGGARTALMARVVRYLDQQEQTRWVTLPGMEIAANVLLFVPAGLVFLALLGRRRWLGVLFASFIASCWIALAQSVWLPMRDSNPVYVVAHVAGAAIGIVLAFAVTKKQPQTRDAHGALIPISQTHEAR